MIRRSDPVTAHAGTQSMLRRADGIWAAGALARLARGVAFTDCPTRVGGVDLPHPMIVAAGLVKGDGFPDEASALVAVRSRRDIIPGWHSLPALAGPVEFGSFTRHPRLGNSGRVLWRDSGTMSMQNRVGLRNPGARAAAAYLGSRAAALPSVWGINVAVSPGVADPTQSRSEIIEAAGYFTRAFDGLEAGPSWLTLNLSCPNTDDDPHGTQSAELARVLAGALVEILPMPLWVKIGPDLSEPQLRGLVAALVETGVRAVVATNTWAQPVPGANGSAGVSGARLRPLALRTVAAVASLVSSAGGGLDIIGGGGILTGADLLAFEAAGAQAAIDLFGAGLPGAPGGRAHPSRGRSPAPGPTWCRTCLTWLRPQPGIAPSRWRMRFLTPGASRSVRMHRSPSSRACARRSM